MSRYSFFAVRRFWLLVPAALLALAVFFAPLDSARPTKAVAQAFKDASPLSSARPSSGPPAVKSTVDLRTLPHTTSARGGALPFRHPRGAAALASEEAAARRMFPPTPVASVTHVFDPLAYGAPAVLKGFNGISSEESGGSGGPCFC